LRAAIFRARQTGNLIKLAGVPVEFGEVHQIGLYVKPAQDLAPDFLLVACRRDNVTADAAGRIGIFPLDLPELLHDAADSG
jgi:hypothetical protein